MTFSPLTNRTSGNGGQYSSRGRPITGWIIHHAATTSLGTVLSMMSTGSREVSSNYVIDVDGEIIGVVPEEHRAWTSASPSWDGRSLTVEIVNSAVGSNDANWQISEASYQAIARLVAETSKRYGFPIDRDHIIRHSEVYSRYGDGYPTGCPSGVSVDRICELARAYAGGTGPATAASTTTSEEFLMGLSQNDQEHIRNTVVSMNEAIRKIEARVGEFDKLKWLVNGSLAPALGRVDARTLALTQRAGVDVDEVALGKVLADQLRPDVIAAVKAAGQGATPEQIADELGKRISRQREA